MGSKRKVFSSNDTEFGSTELFSKVCFGFSYVIKESKFLTTRNVIDILDMCRELVWLKKNEKLLYI